MIQGIGCYFNTKRIEYQEYSKMYAKHLAQMAEREDVTEQLKADNQMEWVGRMNNIRSRASETLNTE